ncbi:unnamed protein product [Didymodactylos carnosus]|uniref:TATA-binding protein-associated factor 172 n=1 Tax=Didymodactylos carnosus TaxID=1234261 RepID=A0A8S2DH17_9BILA|nr:unnamed protein product [Didymodactylos carnosus]CAF3676456.1 unnamed protein product [Didymodactylos carnosus]
MYNPKTNTVVAPVRETCAQSLSVVCSRLDKRRVNLVLSTLICMTQDKKNWEVRHGSLICLKYILTLSQTIPAALLNQIINVTRECLHDQFDDVVAEAGSALIPLITNYEKNIMECATVLITDLIVLLDGMDDLNAAASNIMRLLSKLLVLKIPQNVFPKLFPFVRHHNSAFRLAAIQTMLKILEASYDELQLIEDDPLAQVSVIENTFRCLYQRCVLESDDDILNTIEQAWHTLCQSLPSVTLQRCTFTCFPIWICLLVHPSKISINSSLLIDESANTFNNEFLNDYNDCTRQYYISGICHQYENYVQHDRAVIKCRIICARLLAKLFSIYQKQEETIAIKSQVVLYLTQNLNYRSAVQRIGFGMILLQWTKLVDDLPDLLKERLSTALIEIVYFDEIAPSFTKLKRDFSLFIEQCIKRKFYEKENLLSGVNLHSVDQIIELCNKINPAIEHDSNLNGQRQNILDEAKRIQNESELLTLRSAAYLACACVFSRLLTEQLNPIIRPLMDSLKKEADINIQTDVAQSIAELIMQCSTRQPSPNSKIIKNICIYITTDSDEVPCVNALQESDTRTEINEDYVCTQYKGIYTYMRTNDDICQSAASLCRQNSNESTPSTTLSSNSNRFTFENTLASNTRRDGAELALSSICKRFGDELKIKLPELYDKAVVCINNIDEACLQSQSIKDAQDVVDTLQIFVTIVPHVSRVILNDVISIIVTKTKFTIVRYSAARCIGLLSLFDTSVVIEFVVSSILPRLKIVGNNEIELQGVLEALYHVIDKQAMNIVPYTHHLLIPCIQCMTHQDWYVRTVASNCFATLIKYYPLNSSNVNRVNLKSNDESLDFLEQLLDSSKVKSFQLPIKIQADLRPYQQDGVNWLMFLKRYNLNGVLCDDMGLGKTLMTICVIASDIAERRNQNIQVLPSLIVCPHTLTRHWTSEMEKFVSKDLLNPLHYCGTIAERESLCEKYHKDSSQYTVVVSSYETVRSDITFFTDINFNYCVLDEGHVIKNTKTKLSKAIRQISAAHRLILTGTPIQNNAKDLFILMEFLMPGYLGAEKQFCSRYLKPIVQSRDMKSQKESEIGHLAMELLHKQVKPFMLRRMKSDVLNDLPPKIIQDYYCELSSIQLSLYEDFTASSKQTENIEEMDLTKDNSKCHIFKALQYLRKLCNHPCLILNPDHPKWTTVQTQLKENHLKLEDIRLSGKLLALKDLLNFCGIGCNDIVAQHRALIFCQLKAMIDIVINQVLSVMDGGVTYLRLDGSMSACERFNTVQKFNSDPSIDILLLTTHIGGLGLNLTAADTVIFLEHDWNPSKDAQAMDRAHRIGQKKVVSVYRLITRGTIEEKIMNLQRFKTNLADTVLSADSLETDNLLDLISFDKGKVTWEKDKNGQQSSGKNKKQSIKAILETMSDLWDENLYSDEYDIDKFRQTIVS